MTLIITYRTENGIIMTADSAITNLDTKVVTHNRLKLLRIPYLNAGISFYGKARINGISTGTWLNNFINENNGRINTIKEFIEKLRLGIVEVREQFDKNSGIHISGYDIINGEKKAVFHHLTNKLKNDYWDEELRPDFYDAGFLNPDDFKIGTIIHNGDYLIFSRFLQRSFPLFDSILKSTDDITLEFLKKKIDIKTPITSDLQGQVNLLLIFLEIINEIYSLFANYNNDKFLPVVGGKIAYILITENRIERYETSGCELETNKEFVDSLTK